MNLDDMSIHEMLVTINEEDMLVPLRVKEVLPQIEIAIKHIIDALKMGGKVFYVGSQRGRLGIFAVQLNVHQHLVQLQ